MSTSMNATIEPITYVLNKGRTLEVIVCSNKLMLAKIPITTPAIMEAYPMIT